MKVVPIFYLYASALAYSVGVGIAVLTVPFPIVIVLLSVFVLICLALRPTLLLPAVVIVICCVGGFLRFQHQVATMYEAGQSLLFESTQTISGMVVAEPDVRSSVQYLTVAAGEVRILAAVSRYERVSYGDVVTITGTLSVPEDFETEFDRKFGYKNYLLARGIVYRMSYAEVRVVSPSENIVSHLFTFKNNFLVALGQAIPEPAAGLGAGMLLGVKRALGGDIETAFRKSGLIHIIVLSGYNIMLVVSFLLVCIRPVRSTLVRVLVTIMGIILFAIMVGYSPTVVRASVMAILLIVAQESGRRYIALRGLCIAGFAMILWNPLLLPYDIGFQLSFIATLGLLIGVPIVERYVSWIPTAFGARSIFAASVATYVAVLPLISFSIGELSLVSLPVNMLVLPLVPLAMLGAAISGLVAFVGVVPPVTVPTTILLQSIITIATTAASLPWASVSLPPFSVWWMFGVYVAMGIALYILLKRSQNQ